MSGRPLDGQIVSCADIDDRDLLADYVAGLLPDVEHDAVEIHVMGCARCTADLDTLLLAREELAALPQATSVPVSRSRRIAAAGLAVGLLASAAALIMVLAPARQSAVGGGPESTSRVTPVTPALLALAKVEAPPYSPFTVRSADGTAARFTEAMTAYSRADFHRAADGLRAVVTADGGNVQAQFYLGVSLLMNGDAAAAAERFRAVIATGPSPFHDSSQLLLGKALIRTGDLDAALRALRQASEGAGPRAAEAAALEQQVETARSSLRR